MLYYKFNNRILSIISVNDLKE